MSSFVESLARLYRAGRLTQEQLKKLLTAKKITQKEYEFICSK